MNNRFKKIIASLLIVGIFSTSYLPIAEAVFTSFSKEYLTASSEKITRSAGKCATSFLGRVASAELLSLAAQMIEPTVQVKDNTKMFQEALVNCMSSVAIGIAKDFLTDLTKETFQWAKTGFSGYNNNGFVTSNINALLDNVEGSVLKTQLKVFDNIEHPFGKDFARGEILNYNNSKFSGSYFKSDLENFLSGEKTIFDFAEDFSSGGDDPWDAWVSMTQNDMNNRLGFSLRAKDYLYEIQQKEKAKIEKEYTAGGGVLPQKDKNICEVFGYTKTDAQNKLAETETNAKLDSDIERLSKVVKDQDELYKKSYQEYLDYARNYDLRKEGYTKENLEMLKDFSDKHGARLQQELENLEQLKYDYTEATTNARGECTEYKTITPGSIIKDQLVKTITSPQTQLELADSIDDALTALLDTLLDRIYQKGVAGFDTSTEDEFQTVSIFLDEDGIFSNSSSTNMSFSYKDLGNTFDSSGNITKRGIIQTQIDYKEQIPNAIKSNNLVAPALGELDYCIPGPNPNWEENSSDIISTVEQNAEVEPKGIGSIIFGVAEVIYDSANWINEQAGGNTWKELEMETSESIKMENYLIDLEKYRTFYEKTFSKNSPMQDPTKGSQYLPMVRAGLAETENMVSIINNNKRKINDYNKDSAQATINLKELNTIKDGINSIIINSQKRRDADSIKYGRPTASAECLWSERINLEYYKNNSNFNINETKKPNTGGLGGSTIPLTKPSFKELR